ncbi:MAG: hypothetical protein H0U53_08790 [Actinobacteria bacterium]|nr:hypothetical protein [Actinomycetota bacterium]
MPWIEPSLTWWRKAAALTLALCIGVAPVASASGRRAQLRWVRHASMAQARTEAAFANTKDELYVIGGLSPSLLNTPTVEIYDVEDDRWRSGPTLPVAVNHAMGAAHEGDVYLAGGYLAAVLGATNTFFVLSGGTWTTLPPMPETRAAGSMVAVRDKLYVIGGFSQQGQLASTTLVYDTAAESWSTIPGMRDPREHLSAVVQRGSVIVIGGRKGNPTTNSPTVERFDPRSGKWTRLPSMLQPRSGHACALVGSRFVGCIGGEDAASAFATAEVFDTRARRWIQLPDVSPGRSGLGAAGFDDRLFTTFGGSEMGDLDVTESIGLSSLR